MLPAQEVQAINYSWAIVMPLMAVPLLKQTLRWYDIAAATTCYLGVCTIATQGNLLSFELSNRIGVVLAVLSALIWSTYWILVKKINVSQY